MKYLPTKAALVLSSCMKSLFLLIAGITIAQAQIDFAHEVVPLLKAKCIECHGGEESKGGFSMNDRSMLLEGAVIELGRPDDSILMELLLTDDEDERMPPPKKQEHPLTKEEIDVFRRWIKAEVPWEKGVTFADKRYEPPFNPRKVVLPDGLTNAAAIDYLVGKKMKQQKTSAPSLVDDATFLRRLYLDVTGLPPSVEARKMLRSGKLDREAAIDKVLADNQGYAEHWMVFWNDLLRNEFSGTGFIDNGRSQITYWLYKSLLDNRPYDEFVRGLIAPTKESAGFIKGIKWRGRVNASQKREIQFSQNISQVFLGINMKCASCHDSFVDRWKLDEAYSLAAIVADKPIPLHRCDIPTGKVAKAGWIFPEIGQIDPKAPRDERLKQLAELMTHPQNGRMQRTIVNRIWAQLMGRGIVHPVDAMNTEPWSEELLDHLANTLVKEKYDLKAVIRAIISSDSYRMHCEMTTEDKVVSRFRGPVRRRLSAEQFLDVVRSTIGVWPILKPEDPSFNTEGARHGQLYAVMKAHELEKWDGRAVRTVFTKRDSLQAMLGRPNREQVVTSRPDLVSTLEAMSLANGDPLSVILQKGAANLIKKYQRGELIEHVYASALTREATSSELKIAHSLIGDNMSQDGVEDFLWTIFMLPEFNYVN